MKNLIYKEAKQVDCCSGMKGVEERNYQGGRGEEKPSGMLDMSILLIVLMVSHVCTYVKVMKLCTLSVYNLLYVNYMY